MFESLKKLHQELGTAPTLTYLSSRFLNKISRGLDVHHYIFYSQARLTESRLAIARRNRYEFIWLNQYDTILEQLERPKAVFEDRFQQGAICLAAVNNGLFLGCIWLLQRQYIEDEIRAIYRFTDNAVWDFDVYIIPKKRLTPLFAALWDCADEWMKNQKIDYSLSRISAHNPASVKAHQSTGAKPVGWAIAVTLFNWQISFASTKPKLHISTTNKNAPTWLIKNN